jgi:phenylpyruvate tautomerase PptA (4-oxalocrotonate tautomerase family)
MAHYEIHHRCKLDNQEYKTIARALTELHCRIFATPSAFVHVIFHRTNWHPIQVRKSVSVYSNTQYQTVGGKKNLDEVHHRAPPPT